MNAEKESLKINFNKFESFGYHVVEITKIICFAVISAAILFNIYFYFYLHDPIRGRNVYVLFYGSTAILALIGIKKLKPWFLIPLVFSLINVLLNYAYNTILYIYNYEKSLDTVYQPLANTIGYLILILQFIFIFYWILSVVRCYHYIKEIKDERNYDRMLPSIDLTLSQKSDEKQKNYMIFV